MGSPLGVCKNDDKPKKFLYNRAPTKLVILLYRYNVYPCPE
jgi:hypothetical protein